MNDSSQSPLVLEMHRVTDIGVARNKLRKYAAQCNLPPILRARASVAITLIASVSLLKLRKSQALYLHVKSLEDNHIRGIEFLFNSNFTDGTNKRIPIKEWQLKRACDEISIDDHDDYDQITMRVWTKGRGR